MFAVDLRTLCTITPGVAHQHMPEWANLKATINKGVKKNPGDLAGPGIYACFWDGGLIYIGAFSGTTSDPYAGHVIDRAFKHIVGFTLRSDQLFFNPAPLARIIAELDHDIATELEAAGQRGERVQSEGGPKSELGSSGAFCATYNKAKFAARHWDVLRDATPDDLFNRLTFAYRRIPAPASLVTKEDIQKHWIDKIEGKMIEKFEPICNTDGRRGPDGPPAPLEEVSRHLDRATEEVRAVLAN